MFEHYLNFIKTVILDETLGDRTGQRLFNALPLWVQNVVTRTHLDTFQIAGNFSVIWWVNEHLIFDDCGILALFDNDEILIIRPT